MKKEFYFLIFVIFFSIISVVFVVFENREIEIKTKKLPRESVSVSQPETPDLGGMSPLTCDSSLWKHVYHPQRLKIVKDCISVTGTIASIRRESDGDDHIGLTLDEKYSMLINEANRKYQHGDLVVEPICVDNTPSQTDAVNACKGFSSTIFIPKIGQHVRVVGSYVLDTQHFLWAEIHPVTRIDVVK